MSNQNEGVFSGVVVCEPDLSLEERVIALEKQLTDMQAAMSCGLSMLNARITAIESLSR
ncbi:hypothetical protein [Providencia rettgeri]|uniref:hypothetical protein n=1 Tax=Providencia rettgeri TaxID=587 RepID=UPI001D0D0E6A|nr:hypothetical protein [Providencia rettgeri]MCB6144314.1 hypothetical protein [Providencia rettgeri]MCB6144823.1 hypothetical protein [Providencia rettgeri]MCB6146732.1 hypothetical protein [Providencia rettgeri]MCF8965308.1 hypothetical protein [Providencia rettgeri]UDQ65883.1 hypothetical protein LHK11_11975 [Providencia rettgeri]